MPLLTPRNAIGGLVCGEFSRQQELISDVKNSFTRARKNNTSSHFFHQQVIVSQHKNLTQDLNVLVPTNIVIDAEYRPPTDRYCRICCHILRNSNHLDQFAWNSHPEQIMLERWPHHLNMEALHLSARRGCHLCSLLFMQARSWEGAKMPQHMLYLRIELGGDPYDSGIGIEDATGSISGTSIGTQPPILSRILGDNQSPWRTSSTSSESTLRLANKWLATCENTHPVCSNQGSFPAGSPRRLLLLSGTARNPIVRLSKCLDDQQDRRYLALSHCWGEKLPLVLKQDGLSSFQKSIPFDTLPQTFQDSISITLRLGYRNLWIDALCIIQDSQADKEIEIPRMGIIYGNSVCTIAALSSESSTKGCYCERLPLCQVACQARTKSGQIISLFCPRMETIRRDVYPETSMGSSDGPPLFQRGWVVQERALSPRALYFSDQGLHWECCTAILSESDTWNVNRSPFEPGRLKTGVSKVLRRRDGGRSQSPSISASTSPDTWHRQWWHLVMIFTRCLLSELSDRWPAIAGIAQIFKAAVGAQLIAGMWLEMLYRDMLWEIKGIRSCNRARGRLENEFPTWSWLSVDSRVFLDEHWLSLSLHDCVARILKWSDGTQDSPPDRSRPSTHRTNVFGLTIEAPAMRIPKHSPDSPTESGYRYNSLQEVALWRLSLGDWMLDVTWNSVDPDDSYGYIELGHKYDLWALQWTKRTKITRFLIISRLPGTGNSWCRVGSATFEHWEWDCFLPAGTDDASFEIGPRKIINLF